MVYPQSCCPERLIAISTDSDVQNSTQAILTKSYNENERLSTFGDQKISSYWLLRRKISGCTKMLFKTKPQMLSVRLTYPFDFPLRQSLINLTSLILPTPAFVKKLQISRSSACKWIRLTSTVQSSLYASSAYRLASSKFFRSISY